MRTYTYYNKTLLRDRMHLLLQLHVVKPLVESHSYGSRDEVADRVARKPGVLGFRVQLRALPLFGKICTNIICCPYKCGESFSSWELRISSPKSDSPPDRALHIRPRNSYTSQSLVLILGPWIWVVGVVFYKTRRWNSLPDPGCSTLFPNSVTISLPRPCRLSLSSSCQHISHSRHPGYSHRRH